MNFSCITPSDCLCIGYFLSHVCKMAAGELKVDFGNCSIGDQGCKYLVSGLHKYRDTDSAVTTLLTMNISMNAISHHGVHHLSTLLKVGCIEGLNLSNDETFITSTFYNNTNCNKLGSLRGTLYCSAYQPLLNFSTMSCSHAESTKA